MKFLKVPKKSGEKVRKELMAEGILSTDYPILSEGEYLLFPVTKKYKKLELVEREAEKRPKRYDKLKDALSGFLSESELESVIGSFDLIGDIAIIEIPQNLAEHETRIGEALLQVHKNIKAVFKKLGPMEGEYRVRRVERIAGEGDTIATYKESGVMMCFDVAKVYFSVRLAHERKRIADLVNPGERVLVLFAGVGPFALVIAKKHKDAEIVAIELNPDAVRWMEENIEKNKAGGSVKAVLGDAREVVLRDYQDFADRVIMPLPHSAEGFLDVAFAGVKDGGIIHFYTFADIKDPFKEALKKAETAAKAADVGISVVGERIARPYSAQTVQVVLDLKVRKNQ
ncbi:MAG: class I SAM-dependent methyltransferase family protein [Candidatus Micrarchaeota archaeon]